MFLKILFLSSILACLDKSRNKTKCQIFYKNLIELSPGQGEVDLIIGLQSWTRQAARVVCVSTNQYSIVQIILFAALFAVDDR